MHDPSSVALEIRYPWLAYSRAEREASTSDFVKTYREPFITIWHEDPESDGSDDSCDWFNHKGKLNEKERAVAEARMDMETIMGNAPHFPDSREYKRWHPLDRALSALLWKPSRTHWWQVHPRWHVWHWRIQIHPYMLARRWLLTRCCKCGGRFAYGESPVTGSWDRRPPRLFRGEEGLYHMDCSRPGATNAAQVAR